MDAASALTETPQIETGMLLRLTFSSTDKLLSTFCRLTLTSVGMLAPVPPEREPPLVVPADAPAAVSPAEAGAELPRSC